MVAKQPLAKLVAPQHRSSYKTVAEVAALCQRSVKTVKHWISSERIDGPGHYERIPRGGYVWLYSPEDTLRFVEFASKQQVGRPRKTPKSSTETRRSAR